MALRAGGVLLGLLGLAWISGCGSSEPTGSGGPPPTMAGPPTGNAVFDVHCLNCHATQPNSPPRKGPNLAKVGSTRTPEWLADHVKDPKVHKPESGMPPFGVKLTTDELKSVTDFMTGLK